VSYGCHLVAVLDPHAAPSTVRDLAAAGVEVVVVEERDESGGYLLTRLRTVQRLCAEHPHYRWVNQYESPANPLAHERSTGPEILAQGGSDLDAVYVAVSTGGTLAGVSRHVRAHAPHVRLVAVDAQGSLAIRGVPGRRLLPGIGAGRPSSFLTPHAYDAVRRVSDTEAIALCRHLLASTGLKVGGSSGSVLAALLEDVGTVRAPLALFPDGGRRYADTLYDDGWLARHGLLDPVRERLRRLADETEIELRSENA
jgi:cysteine synthase